jgi:hypothetical protein
LEQSAKIRPNLVELSKATRNRNTQRNLIWKVASNVGVFVKDGRRGNVRNVIVWSSGDCRNARQKYILFSSFDVSQNYVGLIVGFIEVKLCRTGYDIW